MRDFGGRAGPGGAGARAPTHGPHPAHPRRGRDGGARRCVSRCSTPVCLRRAAAAPVVRTCGGAGECAVSNVRSRPARQRDASPTCGGEGQRIETLCGACSRRRRARRARARHRCTARRPSGDYITLRGQGNVGVRGAARRDRGSRSSDDPRLSARAHLIHDLVVTFTQAALAGSRGADGWRSGPREDSAGTQSGRLLRLRGRGSSPAWRRSWRPDRAVTVWVPTELTTEQEALLRQLAGMSSPPDSAVADEPERGF